MTDMYFAPTEKSRQNLFDECIDSEKIYVTGNTVIDAMKTTVTSNYQHEVLDWAKDGRMILITSHRRENIGRPMENIFDAVNEITAEFDDIKVVFPIHLNPRVREIARRKFENNNKVKLIEPLDVFDFHNFQKASYLIMTDSGGVQEEAPSLGKPVIVLRDTTERPEGVEAGTLKLTGTDKKKIYDTVKMLLSNDEEYSRMARAVNPYGDGNASERIVDEIVKKYGH